MEELLIDNIKLERLGDTLLAATALPVSETPAQTFPDQAATFELTVTAGSTATVTLTGIQGGATKTEIITFDGVGPDTRVSINYFDGLSTVSTSGGSAATLSIESRTRSGQPLLTLSTILTTSKARFSSVKKSRLEINNDLVGDADTKALFSLAGTGIISYKDIVTDLATLEKFTVTDVNDVSDSFGYHHTECLLGRKE